MPGPDGKNYIAWSQPEIGLYNLNHTQNGPAYPDFLEGLDGAIHVIEAQKLKPRFHTLNASLVRMLWMQHILDTVPTTGLVLDVPLSGARTLPWTKPLGALDDAASGSFALAVWVAFPSLHISSPSSSLLDARGTPSVVVVNTSTAAGMSVAGLVLSLSPQVAQVRLSDPAGRTMTVSSDEVCGAAVGDGKLHHVVVIADTHSCVVSMVVDGTLCDGGSTTVQGWAYFPDQIGLVPAVAGISVSDGVRRLRLYDRYLRTSEAIAAWRAGL